MCVLPLMIEHKEFETYPTPLKSNRSGVVVDLVGMSELAELLGQRRSVEARGEVAVFLLNMY